MFILKNMNVFQASERQAIKSDLEFFFLGQEGRNEDSPSKAAKKQHLSGQAEGTDTGASLQRELNRLRGVTSDSAITLINRQREIIRVINRFKQLATDTLQQLVAHWIADDITFIPPTLEVSELVIYVLGRVPLGAALVCEHENPLKVAHREVQARSDAASLAHLDATVHVPLCVAIHYAGFDFFVEACVGFTKDTQVGGAIRPPSDQFRLLPTGDGSQHVTKQTEFITRSIGLPLGLRSRGTNSNAYLPSESRVEFGPDGDYYVRALARSRPPLLEVARGTTIVDMSKATPQDKSEEEPEALKSAMASFINQTQTIAGSCPPPWAPAPSAPCHKLKERSEYRLIPSLLQLYATTIAPDSWMGRHPSAVVEGEVLELNRMLHHVAVPKLANYFLIMDRVGAVYRGLPLPDETQRPSAAAYLAEVQNADSLRLLFDQAMEDPKQRSGESNDNAFASLLLLASTSSDFGLSCERIKTVFHRFGVNVRLLGKVIELLEDAIVNDHRLVNKDKPSMETIGEIPFDSYQSYPVLQLLRAEMAGRAVAYVLRKQWRAEMNNYFEANYEEKESGGYKRKMKQLVSPNPLAGVPIVNHTRAEASRTSPSPVPKRTRGAISFDGEHAAGGSLDASTSSPFGSSQIAARQIQARTVGDASAIVNRMIGKATIETLVCVSGDYLSALNGTDEALWQKEVIPMIEYKFGYKWRFNREHQSTSNVMGGAKTSLSTGSRVRVRHVPQNEADKWVRQNKCPAPRPISLCHVPTNGWGHKLQGPLDPLSIKRTGAVADEERRGLAGPRDERQEYLNAVQAQQGPPSTTSISGNAVDLVDEALKVAHEEYVELFEFVSDPNDSNGLPKMLGQSGDERKSVRIGHRQDYRIAERACQLSGTAITKDDITATGVAACIGPIAKGLAITPCYSPTELRMIAEGSIEPVVGAVKDEVRTTRKIWGSAAEYRQLGFFFKIAELYRLQSKYHLSADACKKVCDILAHDNGNNFVGLVEANLRIAKALASGKDIKAALSHAQYAVLLATEHTGHNSQLLTRALLSLLNLYEAIEGNVSENFTKKKIELAVRLQPLCLSGNGSTPVARIEAKAALLQLQHAIQTLKQREIDNKEIEAEIEAYAAQIKFEASQPSAKSKPQTTTNRQSINGKRPSISVAEPKIKEPRKLFRLSAFLADITDAETSLATSIGEVLRTQGVDDELIYFVVRYASQTRKLELLPVLCNSISAYVHSSSPHFAKIVDEVMSMLTEGIRKLCLDVRSDDKEVDVRRRRAVAVNTKSFNLRPSFSMRLQKAKEPSAVTNTPPPETASPSGSTLDPTLTTLYGLLTDPKWGDESAYNLKGISDELKLVPGMGGLGIKNAGAQAFSDSVQGLSKQRSSMWKSMKNLHESNRKVETKRKKKLLQPDKSSEEETDSASDDDSHRYRVSTINSIRKAATSSVSNDRMSASDVEAFGATVVIVDDDEDDGPVAERRGSGSTSYVAPSGPILTLPIREQLLTVSTVNFMRRWLRAILRSVPIDISEMPWEWDKRVTVAPYCAFVSKVAELCDVSPTIGLRCCIALCDELETHTTQLQRQQQQNAFIAQSVPSVLPNDTWLPYNSYPLSSRNRMGRPDDSTQNASIAALLDDVGASNDNPLQHEPWPLQGSKLRYSPLAAPFLHKIVLLMWEGCKAEMAGGGYLEAPIQSAFVLDVDPRRLPRFEWQRQFFSFTVAIQRLMQCLRGVYGFHVAEQIPSVLGPELPSSDLARRSSYETNNSPSSAVDDPTPSPRSADEAPFSPLVPKCMQTLLACLFNGILVPQSDQQLCSTSHGEAPPKSLSGRRKSLGGRSPSSPKQSVMQGNPSAKGGLASLPSERTVFTVGLPQGALARLHLVPTVQALGSTLSPRGTMAGGARGIDILATPASSIAAAAALLPHHPLMELTVRDAHRLPANLVLAYEYPLHLVMHSIKGKVLEQASAVVSALGARYPLQSAELWEQLASFLGWFLDEEQRLYVPRYCKSEASRRLAQHYELYRTARMAALIGRVSLGAVKGQLGIEEFQANAAKSLLGSGDGTSNLRHAWVAQKNKPPMLSSYNPTQYDPDALPSDIADDDVTEVEEEGCIVGLRNNAFCDGIRAKWRNDCDLLLAAHRQITARYEPKVVKVVVQGLATPDMSYEPMPVIGSLKSLEPKVLALPLKRATFASSPQTEHHKDSIALKALSPAAAQSSNRSPVDVLNSPSTSSTTTWPTGLRVTNAVKPSDQHATSAAPSLSVSQKQQMLLSMKGWGGTDDQCAVVPIGCDRLEIEWKLSTAAPPKAALLAVFPCVEAVKGMVGGPTIIVPPYHYSLANATTTLKGLSIRKAVGNATLPCPSSSGKFVVALFHQGSKPVLVSDMFLMT